ncbi:uncharacterized protein LOC116194808 isoform X3 [Punica granatum]|uniref:Uncharacterized protein LOC116194808 isoform X3 n=1 Tax=Punica granatum TaxID=22663 RepID=A0A6P8CB03_PUNGR|nr:uncharacterized protein LOC116194808 isoform X3 [Punica granatum]
MKCIYKKLSDEEVDCCPVCNIDLGCLSVEKLSALQLPRSLNTNGSRKDVSLQPKKAALMTGQKMLLSSTHHQGIRLVIRKIILSTSS